MALSLEKKAEIVRLSLAKRNVPTDIRVAVKAGLDVSQSMDTLYANGTVSELMTRLLAVAMRFDDNGELEMYAFGSDADQVPAATEKNYQTYINDIFIPAAEEAGVWMGGTKYSRMLKLLKSDIKPAKSGLFGGLFGGKAAADYTPSYFIFPTDGDTQYDEDETDRLLNDLASMKIYIQFVGIGRKSFPFLDKMAAKYSHVGSVSFPDLNKTSDEQMYEQLLSDEFCNWIKNV